MKPKTRIVTKRLGGVCDWPMPQGLTHSAAVLRALRRFPSSTSAELARSMCFELYRVRRRLTDLAKAKLVARIPRSAHTVSCRISRKRVLRWEALA